MHPALADIITSRDKTLFHQLYDLVARLTAVSTTWKVSPSDALIGHYKNVVFERVRETVLDTANESMVENLLELKEFLDECLSANYIHDVDQNDRRFTHATSEAFERGFSARRIKPAELIGMLFQLFVFTLADETSQACRLAHATRPKGSFRPTVFRSTQARTRAI